MEHSALRSAHVRMDMDVTPILANASVSPVTMEQVVRRSVRRENMDIYAKKSVQSVEKTPLVTIKQALASVHQDMKVIFVPDHVLVELLELDV